MEVVGQRLKTYEWNGDLFMVLVTGNINPADCATLEFPVSPAGILSPGGCLLLVTNESKQKSNALFIYSFYS